MINKPGMTVPNSAPTVETQVVVRILKKLSNVKIQKIPVTV